MIIAFYNVCQYKFVFILFNFKKNIDNVLCKTRIKAVLFSVMVYAKPIYPLSKMQILTQLTSILIGCKMIIYITNKQGYVIYEVI